MRIIYTDNQQLKKDKKLTYLSSDVSSSGTELTVQSIVGFAIDQIIQIGESGQEHTEIIKTHSSTAPTGTTITLASALVFSHNEDTPIYIIDYDQVEFSWSATATGTKTVLDTIDIQPDQLETQYKDTVETTGYYFTRFKDTINTLYSDYSDAIPFAGFSDNSVWAIKERALNQNNEKIDDIIITHSFLNEKLWEARRIFHNSPGQRPFRRISNYDLGNCSIGQYKIAVPSDLEKPQTATNIFGLRIGVERDMDYITPQEMNQRYMDLQKTTLASDYAIVDATITLSSSRDFPESGTIKIGNDSISYSANTESTGALTISTAGSSAHSSGDQVWDSSVSYGLPTEFTIITDSDGINYIVFDVPIDEEYEDMDIYIDYYKTITSYDSDGDTLDEPDYDMFVSWLSYWIKKRKNQGLNPLTDEDYVEWTARKQTALNNEKSGQVIQFIPS